jgi:predicted ATP-dependent protease
MFFEAIAAVELANQAINGIKELASHVTSVGQMGKQLTQLADAHDELEKESEQGSMEAFWALENIKKKEYEIKQLFIYAGRPGLWEDYQTFIRNRKEMKRKAAEREWLRKEPSRMDLFILLLYLLVAWPSLVASGSFLLSLQ